MASFLQDFQEIVEKEGYYDVNSFLTDWVTKKRKGWWQLNRYLKSVHRYYCDNMTVFTNCSFIYGPIRGKCKLNNRKKANPFPNKNGFRYQKTEDEWTKRAKGLGFENPRQMFRKWKGTDIELARVLGVSYMTICLRRRKSGLKRKGGIKR